MTEQPPPDPHIPSPFPSDAELKRAQRKVMAIGGRLVRGPHRGYSIKYEDKSKPEKQGQKLAKIGPRRARFETLETTGCGHTTVVEIPHVHGDGSRHWLRACLICDGLFLSPNFSGQLEDADG